MLRLTMAAIMAGLLLGAAFADDEPNPPPTEGAAGLEGQFVFNQADGKARGCQVILTNEVQQSHLKSELADDCAEQFEFLKTVAGWDFDGDAILLVDAYADTVIRFAPDKDGMLRGKNETDGREYYLERTSG